MRYLDNTPKDKKFLQDILLSGIQPKAIFSLYVYETEYADSLTTRDYNGTVTEIDMQDGYCKWKSVLGKDMSPMNISVITLTEY